MSESLRPAPGSFAICATANIVFSVYNLANGINNQSDNELNYPTSRKPSAVDVGCRKANFKLEQFMKALYILLAVAGMYLSTSAMAQVSPETLRTCLDIEDQTKERLDCYDDKIKPAPKQVSAPAKTVQDCRFVKEEDERLNCFNRFVNPPTPKTTAQQKSKKPSAGSTAPRPAKQ
jgi:hypothetical protein